MIEVREYVDSRGRLPFREWFRSLDAAVRLKVNTSILRIAEGNVSNLKFLRDGVFEYKINCGPGYRVYLAKQGEMFVILLGGGTKRRQDADIETALGRWQNYKNRRYSVPREDEP